MITQCTCDGLDICGFCTTNKAAAAQRATM